MIDKNSHIPKSAIEIYTAPDNSIQLQVKLDQDTVWLTQKQLADLFGVKKAAISKHVSNIFTSGELDPLATVSKMETVQRKITLSQMVTSVLQLRCSYGSWIGTASSIRRMVINASQITRSWPSR